MASVTYKAPSAVLRKDHLQLFSVFLGGSIEKGKAEEWQDKITKDLEKYDFKVNFGDENFKFNIKIFNPNEFFVLSDNNLFTRTFNQVPFMFKKVFFLK